MCKPLFKTNKNDPVVTPRILSKGCFVFLLWLRFALSIAWYNNHRVLFPCYCFFTDTHRGIIMAPSSVRRNWAQHERLLLSARKTRIKGLICSLLELRALFQTYMAGTKFQSCAWRTEDPIPCWLPSRDCTQPPAAICLPSVSPGPIHLQSKQWQSCVLGNSFHTRILSCKKQCCSEGLIWLGRAHGSQLLSLKVSLARWHNLILGEKGHRHVLWTFPHSAGGHWGLDYNPDDQETPTFLIMQTDEK